MTAKFRTALVGAAATRHRGRIPKPIGSLFAFSAALLLVFTTATTAQAHVVYQDDEVWANTDSSKCLYTYGEVSHGSGAGYAKSYGLASSGIPASELTVRVQSMLIARASQQVSMNEARFL